MCSASQLAHLIILIQFLLPQVNGYPSSPFPTKKYVFVNQYQPLSLKSNTLLTTKQEAPCRSVSCCGSADPVHSCCNVSSPGFLSGWRC
jgi:hypothetical protein